MDNILVMILYIFFILIYFLLFIYYNQKNRGNELYLKFGRVNLFGHYQIAKFKYYLKEGTYYMGRNQVMYRVVSVDDLTFSNQFITKMIFKTYRIVFEDINNYHESKIKEVNLAYYEIESEL